MLKAYCKRLSGRTVVIGATVFKFNEQGMSEVINNGRNQPDFDALMKMHGMEDRCDATLKALTKATEVDTKTDKAAIAKKAADEAAALAVLEAAKETELTKETVDETKTTDTVEPQVGDETEPTESEPATRVIAPGAKKRQGRTKKESTKTESKE